jgi:hypothetical protein
MYVGFWWKSRKEIDHEEDVGGWIILRWILEEQDGCNELD